MQTRRIPAGTTEIIDGPIYAFRVLVTAAGARFAIKTGQGQELPALASYKCPRDRENQERPWDQLTFMAGALGDLVVNFSTDEFERVTDGFAPAGSGGTFDGTGRQLVQTGLAVDGTARAQVVVPGVDLLADYTVTQATTPVYFTGLGKYSSVTIMLIFPMFTGGTSPTVSLYVPMLYDNAHYSGNEPGPLSPAVGNYGGAFCGFAPGFASINGQFVGLRPENIRVNFNVAGAPTSWYGQFRVLGFN